MCWPTALFGDEARDARPTQPCDRRPERVARARRSEGRPYALTKDDQDRVWFSEANTKRLVGFDPKTEKFFANIEVSGAIRNMHFDRKTRTMWFGTDANNVDESRCRTAIEHDAGGGRPRGHDARGRTAAYAEGAPPVSPAASKRIVPRVPLPRGAELSRRTRHHRGRAGEFPAGQRYTLSVTLTRPGMKRAASSLPPGSRTLARRLAPRARSGRGRTRHGGKPEWCPIREPEERRIVGQRSRTHAVDDRVDRAG